MDIKIWSLVVDAHDTERLARFWSAVLGWPITHESDEEWVLKPTEDGTARDVLPGILFVKPRIRR